MAFTAFIDAFRTKLQLNEIKTWEERLHKRRSINHNTIKLVNGPQTI
jgi:hypothetical protein